MRDKIIGYPEDFDTLKKVFGKNNVFYDITVQESSYLKSNPDSGYNTVLRNIEEFPDYLEFFSHGAIIRKIKIMAYEPEKEIPEYELVFFPKKEFEEFIQETSNMIYRLMKDKVSVQ